MRTYRIYTIGPDGRISEPPEVVECADDQEALDSAIKIQNGLDAEIWDQKRSVARLPSNQKKERSP